MKQEANNWRLPGVKKKIKDEGGLGHCPYRYGGDGGEGIVWRSPSIETTGGEEGGEIDNKKVS